MSEKEKLTKLLKVYLGSEPIDIEKPNFMVTYQVIPSEKGKLVREDVRVVNPNTNIRYYGKTPVVFIRNESIADLEVLNIANLVKIALENEERVTHERSIKYVIKNVLKGINVVSIKKLVFYNVMGDVMLKRPHKDYCAYSAVMLKTATTHVGIEVE